MGKVAAGPPRGELRPGRLAFLLCLPALVFLLAIIAYPILHALYLSFHAVDLSALNTGEMPFVGLANFQALLRDGVFWAALRNTVVFTAVSVAGEVLFGLAIALVINEKGIALGVLSRALILLPWAVPPVVNGLMWGFIYSPSYGYLNVILYRLGIIKEFMQFLGNADIALYMVSIPYIWRTTPFAALLFHAALQCIPEELYEAAKVDGANAWGRLWGITLPLLKPTFTVLLVLRTGFAFMVFDEIFAMTQGGPGNATWVAAWYTYSQSFRYVEIGMGAASAYVLALMIAAIAVVYIRLLYARVEYA